MGLNLTLEEVVARVKLKLNRLDTSAAEDVLYEEVCVFLSEALRKVIVGIDSGTFSKKIDKDTASLYLNNFIEDLSTESPLELLDVIKLTLNTSAFKVKDVIATVVDTRANRSRKVKCYELKFDTPLSDVINPFRKPTEDKPIYTFIDSSIEVRASSPSLRRVEAKVLVLPSNNHFSDREKDFLVLLPLVEETENMAVSLILENLESKRLQTQVMLSKL